jgi:hypothetical protein
MCGRGRKCGREAVRLKAVRLQATVTGSRKGRDDG